MPTCACCLNKLDFSFNLYCLGCCTYRVLCTDCNINWPIILSANKVHYMHCSLKCINISIIEFSGYGTIEFSTSNLLQEQQEEILHESRKNAVKEIIQPLNYFINDILCEILTY